MVQEAHSILGLVWLNPMIPKTIGLVGTETIWNGTVLKNTLVKTKGKLTIWDDSTTDLLAKWICTGSGQRFVYF